MTKVLLYCIEMKIVEKNTLQNVHYAENLGLLALHSHSIIMNKAGKECLSEISLNIHQ